MICPVYQQSVENPESPYLKLNSGLISFEEFHQQVSACEDHLMKVDRQSPLAVDSRDPLALLGWLFAAGRTGHCIAIPSTKDPDDTRDRYLQQLNIQIDSLYWDLPIPSAISKNDPRSISHPNQPWCILFTSGSSGTPKAVVHSFSSLWSSALFSHQNIAFQSGDQWIQSLFLWHIGGLMIPIRALVNGATVVQKDPQLSLGAQVDRDQISHLSVVATQLHDLLVGSSDLRSLTAILVGGGTIPAKLVRDSVDLGLPIHTTYGMTELGSQLTTTPPNAPLEVLESAGSPLGDWVVQIGDRDEIQVQGSPLFLGYWTGSNIEDPRDAQGFFGTGDRGRISNDLLYLQGRVDQMFISGGENIYPEEIEEIFHRCGFFAIVVPIPHTRYGQRPVAFVNASLTDSSLEQITTALNAALPKFKRPDHIWGWPEAVSTYKPSRIKLKEIANQLCSKI